jgi:murein L,D-transpeptidase YcbB/YkuD
MRDGTSLAPYGRMNSCRALLAAALLVAAAAVAGCHRAERHTAVVAALQTIVDGTAGAAANVWSDVRAFYAPRHGAPAWVRDDGRVTQAEAILALLDAASEHGFKADDYGRTVLAEAFTAADQKGAPEPGAAVIAALDVSITSAVLILGRDVALGRTQPAAIDPRWKARRTPPDFAGTLTTIAEHDLQSWLDRLRPQHHEYGQLQRALRALEGQQGKSGWPAVPAKALTVGRADAAVVMMRRRLAASGQLTGSAAISESPLYDKEVGVAVKAFQEHYTLKADGIANTATIAAMNVSLEDRISQVRLNLERWRWMPDQFGSRYLLVNIPSYLVVAREDDRDVMDIRAVVGKAGHETPIFSGEMVNVVFSPYWNIPDTIVEGETAPALARDPHYLERNHIEIHRVTKAGIKKVDAKDIDWNNADALKALRFRQLPGGKNALGHVKFLFPNEFDVYLHDTPADALFARVGRAFSHGCVRVEEPEMLAKYVLRGDDSWTEPKIRDAMNAGVEKWVKLKAPIPIHIVYFTATVDENGGLHLANDVYGYDAKQRAMAERKSAN